MEVLIKSVSFNIDMAQCAQQDACVGVHSTGVLLPTLKQSWHLLMALQTVGLSLQGPVPEAPILCLSGRVNLIFFPAVVSENTFQGFSFQTLEVSGFAV